MKIKLIYIFICLFGAEIAIQASAQKFSGSRAIISHASALFAQGEQAASSGEVTPAPLSPTTLTEQCFADPTIQPPSDAPTSPAVDDDQQEGLPIDTHPSSRALASIPGLADAQQPLSLEEIQQIGALVVLRDKGWDTATDDEPTAQQPRPEIEPIIDQSWFHVFKALPGHLWQEYVTDKNRVERIARALGTKTYHILHQKSQQGLLPNFIYSLNGTSKTTEGYNWWEEGVRQAIQDEQEEVLRAILDPKLSPHLTLRKITCELATTYLQHCDNLRKIAFEKNCADLAKTIALLSPTPAQATHDGDDEG